MDVDALDPVPGVLLMALGGVIVSSVVLALRRMSSTACVASAAFRATVGKAIISHLATSLDAELIGTRTASAFAMVSVGLSGFLVGVAGGLVFGST